jgi:Amt family ammonium transporter
MDMSSAINTGWMLTATVAVTLMVPGLALYYGGLSRTKNILNTMIIVLSGFAVTAVLWVLFGYGLTLGDSIGGAGLLGNPDGLFGIQSLLGAETPEGAVPAILIAVFQLIFAGLTVAIVGGAVEGRMKFSAWLVFAGLWATLVYFPVAHWVFAFDSGDGSVVGGFIANRLQAVDFAGGTAVHMNAGVAALVLALFLGKRRDFPNVGRPGNLPIALVGAGLLMVGWYGFNGGSSGGINDSAGVALTNTLIAACTGLIGWLVVERLTRKVATSLGAISGIIAPRRPPRCRRSLPSSSASEAERSRSGRWASRRSWATTTRSTRSRSTCSPASSEPSRSASSRIRHRPRARPASSTAADSTFSGSRRSPSRSFSCTPSW